MEAKGHNLAVEDDTDEATVTTPRFDEEAEETARPVVPLVRSVSDDASAGSASGPRVAVRTGRMSTWPQGLILILAVAAGVTAGATAVYLNTRSTVPSAAPQTSTEATVGGAPEPASTQPERSNVPGASAAAPRGSEARGGGQSVRDEPEGRDRKEAERRGRNEEKLVEHARKEAERRLKEEEKLARREEAEKRAERGRDQEKRGEPKAQLFDSIVVKRSP